MRVAVILLLVPIASASIAPPGTDVVQWTQLLHQEQSATFGPIGFEVHRPHAWNVTNGTSILQVQAQYHAVTQGDEASAQLQLRIDDEALATCQWRVDMKQDVGGLGVQRDHANVHLDIHCLGPFLRPGSHNLSIQLVTGDLAPIVDSTTTVLLHQQESVSMDLDVNINPSTYASIAWILWAIYFVLTNMIRHPSMRVLAAFVGYGLLALPLGPQQFVVLLTAQSIGVLYQATRWFTNRFYDN